MLSFFMQCTLTLFFNYICRYYFVFTCHLFINMAFLLALSHFILFLIIFLSTANMLSVRRYKRNVDNFGVKFYVDIYLNIEK